MKLRLPSHATIIAYLALFVALATGVSWAASKITSSKQIAKDVVVGKHVKNSSLKGKDIKDGSLAGADLKDGGVGAADIADGGVGSADIADGGVGTADLAAGGVASAALKDNSVAGADILNGTITGADLNLGQLGFGQTFSIDKSTTVALDNGGLSSTPRTPQGDVVSLPGLPAGKYLVTARALVTSASPDTDGGGALCVLYAGNENLGAGGASVDEDDFAGGGFIPSIPSSANLTEVVELSSPGTLTYACSDGNTVLQSIDAGIDAVKLPS